MMNIDEQYFSHVVYMIVHEAIGLPCLLAGDGFFWQGKKIWLFRISVG